jgi:hypothetical protein
MRRNGLPCVAEQSSFRGVPVYLTTVPSTGRCSVTLQYCSRCSAKARQAFVIFHVFASKKWQQIDWRFVCVGEDQMSIDKYSLEREFWIRCINLCLYLCMLKVNTSRKVGSCFLWIETGSTISQCAPKQFPFPFRELSCLRSSLSCGCATVSGS